MNGKDSPSGLPDAGVREANVPSDVQEKQLDDPLLRHSQPDEDTEQEITQEPKTPKASKPLKRGAKNVQKAKDLLKTLHSPDSCMKHRSYPHISTYNSYVFNTETYESPRLPRTSDTPKSKNSIDLISKNRVLIKSLHSPTIKCSPLFGAPAPAHRKAPNTHERLVRYQEHTKEKLQEQRKEHAERELTDCSFRPKTNEAARPQRSVTEYYKDVMKRHKQSQEKVLRLRKLREESLHSQEQVRLKPEICRRSAHLAASSSYSKEPCHERLYRVLRPAQVEFSQLSFMTDEGCDSELPFIPKVNKCSRELIRSKPVEILLYEDAVRRMHKTYSFSALPALQPSKHSLALLMRRFLKEFASTSAQCEEKLNYSKYLAMFVALKFLPAQKRVRNEEVVALLEIWDKLGGGSGKVHVEALKVAMMGILGYHEPWMCSGQFTLSPGEVPVFHQRYKVLFENRGTARAFAPTELPVKSESSSTQRIEDSLIEQGKKRDLRLEELRNESAAKHMAECTFQPCISPSLSTNGRKLLRCMTMKNPRLSAPCMILNLKQPPESPQSPECSVSEEIDESQEDGPARIH